MKWRDVWSACGVGLVLALGPVAVAVAADKPVAVEDFFRHARISGPQLSPDGRHIAMITPSSRGDGRMTLSVASIDAPQKLSVAAHFEDADVRSFQWVNAKRLVFSAIDFQTELGNQFGAGLYAVDLDGGDFVWLVERRYGEQDNQPLAKRPLRGNHVLAQTLRDGSDDVIVTRYNLRESSSEIGSTTPVRLNTRTKARKDLVSGPVPEGAAGWALDQGPNPQPVALLSVIKDKARVYLRDGSAWAEVSAFDPYVGGPDAIEPAFADAQGTLYVSRIQDNAERTSALYRFDRATRRIADQPLLDLKGYDFSGEPVLDGDSGELLGVSYLTDARGTAWFNAQMKADQAEIDRQLPGTNNLLGCSRCLKGQHLVVMAYSDRQSPVYFLYERASRKLSLIGASRPWLDAKRMAERDFLDFKARDGLRIPVHVTRPQGKGPWPAVVLVHGGPMARGGEWGWSPDGQFLASRGYVVIEPEFRGGTGFGARHFRAGWKQWGLAMQDDVTDATRWAIAQGLADPRRIAIAGASYGGYATMMGLVKEPELYRAGINWVGVTDIPMMYDIGWSDFAGGDWSRYGMPRLIGDPVKDAEQLAATSPLKQAARIVRPVLMAYGGEDYRVPLPHGTRMRDALKAAGKVEVEWVVYPEEGHGWLLEKNNVDFWRRVEAFLGKHLQ